MRAGWSPTGERNWYKTSSTPFCRRSHAIDRVPSFGFIEEMGVGELHAKWLEHSHAVTVGYVLDVAIEEGGTGAIEAHWQCECGRLRTFRIHTRSDDPLDAVTVMVRHLMREAEKHLGQARMVLRAWQRRVEAEMSADPLSQPVYPPQLD